MVLRQSSANLSSLTYFNPNYMSLSTPHPIWTTCEGNSFEIAKALIAAKFLSGRYRTDKLLKHFSKDNTGNCSLCNEVEGSLEHLLVVCPVLAQCRQNLLVSTDSYSEKTREIISNSYNKSVEDFVQLLLDCSVKSEVIKACQTNENFVLHELFKFARTWCFNVHMKRMKILGKWTSY